MGKYLQRCEAKKLIFMRDIKKIGIKRELIKKLIILIKLFFFKKETKFPEIVLIGSSAGGYLHL